MLTWATSSQRMQPPSNPGQFSPNFRTLCQIPRPQHPVIHFGNRDNHASSPSEPGAPASYPVSQAHPLGVRARLCPVVVLQLWLLAPPRVDTAARDREPGRARRVGTRADLASALPAPLISVVARFPGALVRG